ncbi:MAG: cohesin domain-containing protein [Candidatus Daviesbacteria bacterium]
MPSSVYAAGASLTLSPATGTFNKGCSVSVDILLDTGGTATDGTDVILNYDPTRFSVQKIISGTIYADYPGNSFDAQNGRITVSGLSSVSTAFTGQGTLATIDLMVLDAAPTGATQITFDFDTNDRAKTTDSNVVERTTVVDVLNEVTNGSYTVGTGSCSTTRQIGGPDDTTPIPTKVATTPLPDAADFQTTFIIAAAGSILIILGILGLVLL